MKNPCCVGLPQNTKADVGDPSRPRPAEEAAASCPQRAASSSCCSGGVQQQPAAGLFALGSARSACDHGVGGDDAFAMRPPP